MKQIKFLGMLSVVFGVFLIVGSVSAAEADSLQPAATVEYSEPVSMQSTLTVAKPGYFTQGIHIGSAEAGAGGVTYFNGTIVNASVNEDDEDVIPVTFGDDVRIDGRVWRGETAGAGEGMPFIINDDVEIAGTLEFNNTNNSFIPGGASSGEFTNIITEGSVEIGGQLTVDGYGSEGSNGITTRQLVTDYIAIVEDYDTFIEGEETGQANMYLNESELVITNFYNRNININTGGVVEVGERLKLERISSDDVPVCDSSKYGEILFSADGIGSGGDNQFYGCGTYSGTDKWQPL